MRTASWIIVVGALGGLFFGWLIALAANVLGVKGGFFEGLTSVAYSVLYLSMGFLITGIFSLLSNPAILLVASFVSVMIFGVMSYMVLFRAVKDLFATDLLTTFIIVGAIFAVAAFSVYSLVLGGALTGILPAGSAGTIIS